MVGGILDIGVKRSIVQVNDTRVVKFGTTSKKR